MLLGVAARSRKVSGWVKDDYFLNVLTLRVDYWQRAQPIRRQTDVVGKCHAAISYFLI